MQIPDAILIQTTNICHLCILPLGSTTYTCMTNKDGGVEADLTVSVLQSGDGSSVVKPKFEGEILLGSLCLTPVLIA